jgi:CheY-like chemotaxis protein
MPHYKILVIDYEPRGVAQLRDPLHAAGYLVSVAHDGMTGMKLFEELKPDLTLIEAMLPKKHGFEVCKELKATPHGNRSPVVIVTSVYRGRKYRTQALHNYHCDEFLEKPIASDFLLATVGRLLKGRRQQPDPQATAAPQAEAPEREAPTPAPAKKAAPGEPAQADPVPSAPAADEAELEISERLDELLGGGPSSVPEASVVDPKPQSKVTKNVVSFDPARLRKPGGDPPASSYSPAPDTGSTRRTHGNAQPIRAAEHAPHPVGDRAPQRHTNPLPEVRRRPLPAMADPQPAHGLRRRWLLYLTILFVAAASSILFLLYWPF